MISSTDMEAYLQKFLQKFQHLKIQLEDIKKATNNFNDKHIGVGGFGKVYKGEVTHAKGRSMVAIKCLNHDPKKGPVAQGVPEFLKEITMLSDYKHENLISLLGFCCEGGEKILVYELASRGSLDRYLNSPHLTWGQRLKICLDAAKGLRHLHDPRKTHRRLIHCDVKSPNILLDDQWNAKVSDFGLSTMGSANEQHSVIVTPAAGTGGYIDPLYWMTHTLTKESDVYSFGVVLFEVLCGRFCYTLDSKGHHVKDILVPTWIKNYEQNKLNDIIFTNPSIKPMQQGVLERVSGIAYRCLKESREARPEMAEVVTELERALNIHELLLNKEFIGKWSEQLYEYQQMIKTAEPPLNYKSEDELIDLLFHGVLLNYGKTWFSLNKKGEHYEMISIVKSYKFSTEYNSRIAMDTHKLHNGKNEINVRTQFLSPGITYTVNLVFKFGPIKESLSMRKKMYGGCEAIFLRYKLQGERESSISHLAYEREDGWWMCELYQFTCNHRIVHLQILFEKFFKYYYWIEVEGIEFQPLESLEPIDEKLHISDSYSYSNCEENLPIDFEEIMKRSKNSMQWTTKEEAYSIIRKGFLIIDDNTSGHIWFSIDKNGKKCHMLPAKAALEHIYDDVKMLSLPESRFGEVVLYDYSTIYIKTEVQSQLVSSKTTYACYLVYKLPKDQSRYKDPVEVDDRQCNSGDKILYIYLTSPQTPIIRPEAGQNTHNPLNRPKFIRLPRQRSDGWMEVRIREWRRTTTTIYMDLRLNLYEKSFRGLIIEGIEYRPI